MNSFRKNIMNSKPLPLEDGYSAEFDAVNKNDWYKIINQFSDANIYQTWDYDAIRCRKKTSATLFYEWPIK